VLKKTSHAAKLVGEQIRKIRLDRGLTQDQVAVAASIDSSNVRAMEAGRNLPSVPSLVRVAKALGCSTSELIDHLEPEHFEV
jgi:transcriptional regulator with XRE-family HTH domain